MWREGLRNSRNVAGDLMNCVAVVHRKPPEWTPQHSLPLPWLVLSRPSLSRGFSRGRWHQHCATGRQALLEPSMTLSDDGFGMDSCYLLLSTREAHGLEADSFERSPSGSGFWRYRGTTSVDWSRKACSLLCTKPYGKGPRRITDALGARSVNTMARARR